MLTKEEIIADHLGGYHKTRDDFTTDVVIPAMDYYARQVAIDFVEWMQRYSLYDYSKRPYKYIVRQQPTSGRSKPEQFTAEQLFDLYLKSK